MFAMPERTASAEIRMDRHSKRDRHLVPRRDVLQLGALGAFGLSLPGLVQSGAAEAGAPVEKRRGSGRAGVFILVSHLGGPPHQDTFDMKPAAPAEVRGEFRPIRSTVPGLQV